MKMHLIATALFCCSSFVSATQIVYEPFDYPAGTSITGQSPDGGTHSWNYRATASGDVTTVTPASNLALPSPQPAGVGNSLQFGGTGETERINIGTNNAGTGSGVLFYSYAIKVTDLGKITASQLVGGFNNDNSTVGSTNPTVIAATLWVQPTDNTVGDASYHTAYNLGISTTSGAATRVFDLADTYSLGTTLFVIGEYDFSTGFAAATSHLWIYSPTDTLPDTAPTPTVSGTVGATSSQTNLLSFLYYQNNTSSANSFGNNGINVDELRIGTTWTDVVPEPASISLVSLAAASLLTRRTRRIA
ncbi:MAG TPA: hypothetical protein VFE58_04370 [Tepidisphaeraceae bacterium]|jgi:hypothetical protein|nr:hypothetical protein [Tepidisphaeraceae bacterium]